MSARFARTKCARILSVMLTAFLVVGLLWVAPRRATAKDQSDRYYISMDIILKKSEGVSLTFSAAFNVNATSYTFNAGELKRTLDDNLTMDEANYWKDKVEDHDYPFSQKPGEYAKEICVLTGEGDHGLSVTFKAQALDSYYYVEAKNGDHGTASIASPATDKKYAPESKLNISATPATGYSFNKWTYSVEEGPKASFGSDTSASTTFNVPSFDGYKYLWSNNRNYTVTPSFNPNTYTVAFDKNADDATGSMENQSFTYDTAQNLYENAFEYDGHVFAGWTTNAEGTGTVYADKQSVKNLTAEANATVTLYAQWESVLTPHEVTVNADPVTGGEAEADVETANAGETVTVTATPFEGFEFAGWQSETPNVVFDDATAAQTTFVMVDSDVVATASFEEEPAPPATTCTVTFDANGGSGTMAPQEVESGVATALDANEFSRSGYTFSGWNTEADGSGDAYGDGAEVTATEDLTLYAQWEEEPAPVKTFSITVEKVEGGVVAASKKKAAKGDPITVSATPKNGYTFDSWDVTDEDGNTIKVKSALAAQVESSSTKTKGTFTMPASNVTVAAQFKEQEPEPKPEPKPQPATNYTITFDKNAGDATGTMDAQTVKAGASIALNANQFARNGYNFNGWNTAADGSGTKYANGANVTPSANMTLYAQWAKKAAHEAPAPTIATNRAGRLTSSSDEVVYTISQKVPSDTAYMKIWLDLNETMYFTMAADGITVRLSNGTEVVPSKRTINGQRLEVTFDDARAYAGDTMQVVFRAKQRDNANLQPYLKNTRTVASVPHQAHSEFRYTDGETATAESPIEHVNFAVGGSSSTTTTRTKGATTTTVKQNSALAKTADPTSIAQSLVACGLGVVALASGAVSRRRRK